MNRKRGAKRGRLSAQGDISFHATFDRHAHREAGCKDGKAGEEMIHVGEIVFAKLDGTSSSMRKLKARPGGPTISVCAALPKSNDNQTTFPSNHKYVGVTKTKLDAGRSPKEQRFVVQCGGLATIRLPIVDEGSARIYCVGDLLLCEQPDKNGKDLTQRACMTTDYDLSEGKLCRGDLPFPIVGRCLGNGRSGDTMDVILSGNAPGIYCLPPCRQEGDEH